MADEEINGNREVCKVYAEDDFFTAFVQMLLAALALASLWVKRQQERPRRKFLTWFLDMSKQGFGAVYSHIMNMVIAAFLASNLRGEIVLEDECAWYAINYVIDTTLGLFLSIIFIWVMNWIANYFDIVSLKDSGVYVGRAGLIHWLAQLLSWLFILTITKVIICYVMWLTSPWLAYIGDVLFAPLQGNIRFELLFVMIVFPGICNVIYFWIVDTYLKAEGHHKHAHEDASVCPPTSNNQIASDEDGKDQALISQDDREPPFTSETHSSNAQDSRIDKISGDYDAPRPVLV